MRGHMPSKELEDAIIFLDHAWLETEEQYYKGARNLLMFILAHEGKTLSVSDNKHRVVNLSVQFGQLGNCDT